MTDPESSPHGRKRLAGGWLVLSLAALGLAVLWLAGPMPSKVSDLWWSATHPRTATAFGKSFGLPFPWRQGGSPQEEHTLELRNTLREVLASGGPDQIVIREAENTFDAVEMAQRWERLETRSMIPGDRLEPTPKDAFLRAHYRCSDVKRSRDGRIQLACFDKEGRWVVLLRGRESEIEDLATIMQSVSERGSPGQR